MHAISYKSRSKSQRNRFNTSKLRKSEQELEFSKKHRYSIPRALLPKNQCEIATSLRSSDMKDHEHMDSHTAPKLIIELDKLLYPTLKLNPACVRSVQL